MIHLEVTCSTIFLRCYYITDRRLAGGTAPLLRHIERNIKDRVDMIQIREKDLEARALFELTLAAVRLRGKASTKILVNSRADVALAAGADGVHLPADAPSIRIPGLIVGRSCHTIEEVRGSAADFVTFGPIFSSPGKGQPLGTMAIREAAVWGIPVYALGGINMMNAQECIDAGAEGIAGIRMFQGYAVGTES